MAEIINKNQKARADSQDSLIRRPVELNHTPLSGAVRLSGDDQNRLVSTSSRLRNFYYINEGIKNNNFIAEDAVFGFADGNVTSPDNHLYDSKSKNYVKSNRLIYNF